MVGIIIFFIGAIVALLVAVPEDPYHMFILALAIIVVFIGGFCTALNAGGKS